MIGSNHYPASASLKTKLLARLFGNGDIHTQYRLTPVISFLKSEEFNHNVSAIELGCGPGLNLIEFARIAPHLRATGYDLDDESIAKAKAVSSRIGLKNISFINKDALLVAISDLPQVDYLLLIDFLEHVESPNEIVSFARRVLSQNGKMIISVPTPLFPTVVGRKMHDDLGHLVDGYTLEMLDRVIGSDFHRMHHAYSTGPLASAACRIYYQHFYRWGTVGRILGRVLTSFRPPDWFCHFNNSISLFAVYQLKDRASTQSSSLEISQVSVSQSGKQQETTDTDAAFR
jgi:SAM-dependent methyltransferase